MEAFIGQFGYIAVAALIFLETVFPPIPSEVILPMAGFLTASTDMVLPGVIIAATLGSLAGAFILYGVGRVLSRERLMRLCETRPLRLLGFRGSDVERVVGWFDRRGQITVLICRCVPGLRSLISIPAGTARMGLGRFTLYTLVGSAVWNTLLCSLGAAAGSAWQQVSDQVAWVSDIVVYVLAAVLVIAAVWWIARRAIPAWRETAGRSSAKSILDEASGDHETHSTARRSDGARLSRKTATNAPSRR